MVVEVSPQIWKLVGCGDGSIRPFVPCRLFISSGLGNHSGGCNHNEKDLEKDGSVIGPGRITVNVLTTLLWNMLNSWEQRTGE